MQLAVARAYTVSYGPKRNSLMYPLKEEMNVAANPLTWTLRHATVQTDAVVKDDGTIILNHYVSDILDLRPGVNHTPAYNQVTTVLGGVYHDILRGADNLQVRGSWSNKVE